MDTRNKIPVFRFAPSPNGRLHLGHAYSALLNATLAMKTGGRFLLRLEDIDTTRCTADFAKKCLEDLTWLGLTWETPVRIQSQHGEDYRKALDRLKQRKLVYPCFCSRQEISRASNRTDPDGAPIYPGTCRNLPWKSALSRIATGTPHVWRLDIEKALAVAPGPHNYQRFTLPLMIEETVPAHPARWGDTVLARKEITTSYHLSVVVDDALQGVTHVVRGIDLKAATCLHVLLQALLELPTPYYHHHALMMESIDKKLSKSRNSEALVDLRQRGISAVAIRESFRLPCR